MVDTNNIEDKIFSEKNGNFQTMNMIYKIKKIKKKKRADNPKKIPFPEVLTNIKSDEPVINDKKSTTKEGFGFNDDDWDGYDNVKDKFEDIGGKDPRQVLIDFINNVYDSIVKYNKQLAKTITNKISKTEVAKEAGTKVKDKISEFNKSLGGKELSKKYDEGDENADEKRVYNYLCILEALIFSSFVVNNWYFLMFYNKQDDGVDKFELFDFSVDKIKRLSNDFLSNKILKYIVLYFIEYALVFPTALEYFLINIFPNYSSKFFNHTFCYIVLFFIIFFVSYNFAWGLKQFLINVINFNKKNVIVMLMFAAVVVLYLIPDTTSFSGVLAPKDTKEREMNIINKDRADINSRLEYIAKLESEGKKVDPSYLRGLINKQKLANDYAERINNKKSTGGGPGGQETAGGMTSSGGMMSVLKLIWNAIRFMIIITISVPLGGIFCGIYFIFYSLYAMFYYCNMDFKKTYETFTDMLKFLDNHKVELNKNVEGQSFFEQLMQRFNEYFEYMSDNFFILVYLFTFVYLITDTQKRITNTTLRNTLYVTELSIIFSIVGYLIYVIRSKYNVDSLETLAEMLRNNTPIEKDYGLSADMFNIGNMAVYGVTIIGLLRIGFRIIKIILFTPLKI